MQSRSLGAMASVTTCTIKLHRRGVTANVSLPDNNRASTASLPRYNACDCHFSAMRIIDVSFVCCAISEIFIHDNA